MKKVKLRKRKRKVYFQYGVWIPLKYYNNVVIKEYARIINIDFFEHIKGELNDDQR